MTKHSSGLDKDPLFLGLTRPPLLLGVSYTMALFNGLTAVMYFVLTSDFKGPLLIAPTIHGIAYLICLKEPRALELLITKTSKCSRCKNKMFHKHSNSYDVY